MKTFLGKLAFLAFIGCVMVAQAGTMERLHHLVHDGYGRKARLIIRPLLVRKPNDASLIKLYIQALLIDGRFRKAFPYVKKLIHKRPHDANDWIIYAGVLAAKSAKAGVFSLLGHVGQIHQALKNAVRVAPKNMAARMALMLYDLQAPGFLGGSNRQGKLELRAIRAHSPAQGRMAEAEIFWAKGHRTRAIAELQQAILEKPSLKGASLKGAKSMLAQDELMLAMRDWKKKRLRKEALHAFQSAWGFYRARAIRGKPRRFAAFYHMGMIAAVSGMHLHTGVQALEYYLSVTPPDQDPSAAWAHFRLGLLFTDLDYPRRARDQYGIALAEARHQKSQIRKQLLHKIKHALARLRKESASRPHR
ncbi:MAG: tetratricopeptide repeat protein [Gammaproteobacteria bacterium]